MEPSNPSWLQLIFPRCEPAGLVPLRFSCRGFRHLLDSVPAKSVWLPFTMLMSRLRYDERVDGWSGILRAMRRESETLANCRTGRYILGPLLDVPHAQRLLHVGGRLVAFFEDATQLFRASTGTLLLEVPHNDADVCYDPIQDRWLAFIVDGRGFLLDCVEAKQEFFDAELGASLVVESGVAGARFSVRWGTSIIIMEVNRVPDRTTVREVGRVPFQGDISNFGLCERGQSYLLYRHHDSTVCLIDLNTGEPKRVFALRKGKLVDFFWQYRSQSVAAAMNAVMIGARYFFDETFFVATIRRNGERNDNGGTTIRIRGDFHDPAHVDKRC